MVSFATYYLYFLKKENGSVFLITVFVSIFLFIRNFSVIFLKQTIIYMAYAFLNFTASLDSL